MVKSSNNFAEILEKLLRYNKNSEKTIMIITAVKLENADLSLIKKIFSLPENCKVVNKVDSNILGGLIFKFGSQIIDLSIKGQLKNFKKQFNFSI